MSLFQPGEFRSHSGVKLPFKVECDCLTERDLDLFAELIATRLYRGYRFKRIVGVPKSQPGGRDNGGVLAQYVRRHLRVDHESPNVLLVDDVLTTGASMERLRDSLDAPVDYCLGAVIFARGPCLEWVRPVFTLNELAW